jgi:hypothetical protein
VHLILRSMILTLLAGVLTAGLAAPAAIGTATANGDFFLDRAAVKGNATVLDGTLLETATAPSLVRLDGGTRMRLGSASRARVFANRLVLEKGVGEVAAPKGLQLEAGTLRIVPEATGTSTRVSMTGPGTVTVAALAGNLRVTTAQGLLLARIETGSALEFQPQAAGASAPLSLTGCVSKADGHYLLHAESANVTFDLRGEDLDRYSGHRVTVTATALTGQQPAGGASQAVQVTQIKSLGTGCGSAAGAATTGTASTAGRASLGGGTKAIIAGVAVAAVAGGTTLGLTRDEDTPAAISR